MPHRKMKTRLMRATARHPITVLGGPLHAGKTALVKETFSYAYVSLSHLESRSLAASDPVTFMQQYYYPTGSLIIDDIHLVPGLIPHIAAAVAERPFAGSFILLSSRRTLEGLPEEHTHWLTLLPPSLAELNDTEASVEEMLYRGAYCSPSGEPRDHAWQLQYLQNFFEKELPRQLRLTRPESFVTFARLCAGAIGEVVNHSRLGDNCGVSHNTARIWLKILEDNYLVFLLRPHQEGFGKRMVKTPKLYFYDTGLACALLGIHSPAELVSHYHRGALFESLMISDLLKEKENTGKRVEYFFWRDKLGNEVDILAEEDGVVSPTEIKPGKTISASYFEGLNRWNQLSGSDSKESTILYAGEDNHTHPMATIESWRTRTGTVVTV